MLDTYSDPALAALTAAAVAAIRQHVPKLDGWAVPLSALVFAALFAFVARDELGLRALLHVPIIWLEAVGGVSLLHQVAKHAAPAITTRPTTIVPGPGSLPPPPPMPPVTVDQDAITTPKDYGR